MSVKLTAKAWETNQKGNDLLVLLALCDFANDEGIAFPSLKTLCEKAKVSKATLSYILRAYEKIGVLKREKRKRENGSDTSTIYQILTLEIDEKEYKKAYQDIRKYTAKKEKNSQCEHPLKDKIVNTQNANCEQGVFTQCEHLEPSINHQDINHHLVDKHLSSLNTKEKIEKPKKVCEEKNQKIKPFDIISFYKKNISNSQKKIREINSYNAMQLLEDDLPLILTGLKNYSQNLPQGKYVTNLQDFIRNKIYLDYQNTSQNTNYEDLARFGCASANTSIKQIGA